MKKCPITKPSLLLLKTFKEFDPGLPGFHPAFRIQQLPCAALHLGWVFSAVCFVRQGASPEEIRRFYFPTHASGSTRIKSSRDERVTKPVKQLCSCDFSQSHSKEATEGKKKPGWAQTRPGPLPHMRASPGKCFVNYAEIMNGTGWAGLITKICFSVPPPWF